MPASSLADVVDSLLGKGSVVLGETSISLAGVDLVYLQLQLMLSSTSNLVHGGRAPSPAIPELGWPSAPRHQSIPDDEHRSGPPLYEACPEARRREPAASPTKGEAGEASQSGSPPYEGGARGGSPAPTPTDESPDKGLARLALTVVELLRQTVERQAVRRVEAGGLNDEEVERMGVALMELEEKMAQLRGMFGLTEEETNVDLGPIGKVL